MRTCVQHTAGACSEHPEAGAQGGFPAESRLCRCRWLLRGHWCLQTFLVSLGPPLLAQRHHPLSGFSKPLGSFPSWAFAQMGPWTWGVFTPLPDRVPFLLRSSLKGHLLKVPSLAPLTTHLPSIEANVSLLSPLQSPAFHLGCLRIAPNPLWPLSPNLGIGTTKMHPEEFRR